MARAHAVIGNAPVEWPIGESRRTSSMRIRMRYVRSWIDRKTGRTYAFFRRRGYPSARLPGSIGSAEFLAAYHACLRGEHPAPAIAEMKARSGPGTINAAVAQYLDSNTFMRFGDSTRALRRSILKQFCRLVGDKPIAPLDRKYIDRLLQSLPSPVVARTWLLALRPLLQWAMTAQMIEADPTVGIKIKLPKTDGHDTWSDEQIAQFEARHPIGSRERLAFALLVHTGQRRSDILRMGRQHIHDGVLTIKQQKTGEEVFIPVHPELAAAIAACPSGGHLTFLTTERGAPVSEREFNRAFRAAVKAAGLPETCVPHGLRKACARRLAEQGCTSPQIAAITGHRTLKEVERYIFAYDRKRAAKDAMAKLVRS
jgi:integrase